MATPCKRLQKAAKKRVFCAANVSLTEPFSYDILMKFGAPRASLQIARIATFSYSAPAAPIVFLTPRPASILVLSVFFFDPKARERPCTLGVWEKRRPKRPPFLLPHDQTQSRQNRHAKSPKIRPIGWRSSTHPPPGGTQRPHCFSYLPQQSQSEELDDRNFVLTRPNRANRP